MIHPSQLISMDMVKAVEDPLFWLYLLTSSFFCTGVAIILTTWFCILFLLYTVTVAESLALASTGQMLNSPFGCSFQLQHLLFTLMMKIGQKMLECCFHNWNSYLAAHVWLSTSELWCTCVCSGKEGNSFFSSLIWPENKSQIFTKFCDVCKACCNFLIYSTLVLLWDAVQKATLQWGLIVQM